MHMHSLVLTVVIHRAAEPKDAVKPLHSWERKRHRRATQEYQRFCSQFGDTVRSVLCIHVIGGVWHRLAFEHQTKESRFQVAKTSPADYTTSRACNSDGSPIAAAMRVICYGLNLAGGAGGGGMPCSSAS